MQTIKANEGDLARLERERGVLVEVSDTRGSTPRESGAWMVVWPEGFAGTIGGGNLEYQALAAGRAMLAARSDAPADGEVRRYALGPSLGQCCGGAVMLRYRLVTAADCAELVTRLNLGLAPVAVFGAGHVGVALVRVLSALPFSVHWVDSREEAFPAQPFPHVQVDYSDPMHAAVDDLAPGSHILVMSFSHWEDLDIVRACLERKRRQNDLPFIGLIGSETKWAMFQHRLQARGFSDEEIAQITCPIGIPGLNSKKPEIISVAVAAQLLINTLPLGANPLPGAGGPGIEKSRVCTDEGASVAR